MWPMFKQLRLNQREWWGPVETPEFDGKGARLGQVGYGLSARGV
jgi:hypothetical protein